MPLEQITSGSPPLLWSNVNDAFTKINANFETLAASIGGGGSLIDFEQFDNNVIPATSNSIRLGDIIKPWKRLHVDSYRDNLTDTMNGLWLGSAHIKGIDTSVDLPSGSTVAGNLIIDPEKTFFKRVSVDDFNVVEANEFSDTLNLAAGAAMQLVVDSSAERITINNAGVTGLIGGTAISVSAATGNITVTNTGVTSLSNTTTLPSGLTAGSGITVSAANGAVMITNTGVLQVQQGFGITVSTDVSTGIATISNSAPAQVTFRNYVINGDNLNPIVADSTSDTLYINTGYGLTTTKDPSTDTINIALNQRIDILGSVFGDDSALLVDGVMGRIIAPVYTSTLRTSETKIVLGLDAGGAGINAIAIGEMAGQYTQGNRALAVGFQAGLQNQGVRGIAIGQAAANSNQGDNGIAIGETAAASAQGINAIAIGQNAGITNQGASAIAIGAFSAGDSQGANAIAIGRSATGNNQVGGSIVINASGAALNSTGAGFYVNPVRSTTSSARPLVYNASTSEIFYTSTLEFINSTISTTDSSGLTVDVQTTFNSDVLMENDLTVNNTLLVRGSKIILLNDFKSLVAASVDFADFKARVAALV